MSTHDLFTGATARLLGITLLMLVAIVPAAPAQATTEQRLPDAPELQHFFDSLIPEQLESLHIPGAALAVVRGDELLLAKGYGYADLETQRPVDPARTLFRTGSVAKLFTATAVMQLVEQGRLDLHADVNDYLDFTIPATYARPITLAHLLTHTPGFEDHPEGLFVYTLEETQPLGDYLKQGIPARVFPPGEVIAYSNYGMALAGYIVERLSGEPFALYVENHIFAPLGMEHSTIRQPLPPALADEMARGYNFHNGDYVKGGFLFVGPYPAGAMSAPAADLAPFMIAHLQEGRYGERAILQPATVHLMQRRHYTADPRLDGMAYGFMEQQVNGQHILFHRGSTFQFNAALYLLPAEQLGIYLVYNGVGAVDASKQLMSAFMDRFYPAPALAQATLPASAAARLAPYTGEYHLARAQYSSQGAFFRLLDAAQVGATPEGALSLTVAGETETYVELEPGLFRHHLRDERLAFYTDPDGALWLSLDGNPAFVSFTATLAYRAPWYATLPVAVLLIVGSLLLFVISMVGWSLAALRRRRQGTRMPLPARLARWTAALFGLLFVIFLGSLLSVLGDIDPAYGLPRVIFREPPIVAVIALIPWLLAAVGVGQLLFTGMAWRGVWNQGEPYWRLWGRLHYTALTVMAALLLWWFWYWNFLW
jgi:CubicO group peptidase (beta-lactamase class C family)